jgi:cardiolipin synthase A/B
MDELQVAIGTSAHDALCNAFAQARSSIDAEFFSISDPSVINSLNEAAARGVHVRLHVEARPHRYDHRVESKSHAGDRIRSSSSLTRALRQKFSNQVDIVLEDNDGELMHGKAAVVDDATAYITTTNPTWRGFANPGDALISDAVPRDVQAVKDNIDHKVSNDAAYAVGGPSPQLRERLTNMFSSSHDLSIASEDLSDRDVVAHLVERQALGHHDRVLIGDRRTAAEMQALDWLRQTGVEVRTLSSGYMHAKYVDDGDELYVGSANLTRNGLDEAHEIGIIAPAKVMPSGAATLRAGFEANWSHSIPA